MGIFIDLLTEYHISTIIEDFILEDSLACFYCQKNE